MDTKVIYEESGENNRLTPILMVLDKLFWDWHHTLYIKIDAPFEVLTFEELDYDVLSVMVPDNVYVNHSIESNNIGLHLPSLYNYIKKHGWNVLDVRRLILRISDIEDTLQYDIKNNLLQLQNN
ncbi:hypothetical protein [Paenibacillus sp. GXUN7292]|uniref:hypothetical protein n=1 Tax=Paenibacillus sp. GXUN7292 TaxID=3422499 RepID=UPI003D7D4DFA